jgi:hypothetical protein
MSESTSAAAPKALIAASPVEGALPVGLVAVHKDYRLHEADPQTTPAHEFSSWASMRRFAQERFGAGYFEVFVGPVETLIYRRGCDWAALSCGHWVSDESALWRRVLVEKSPLTGRSLHELLNSAESAIVDPIVREKLRSFASRRLVKATETMESEINDTGTVTHIAGARGEKIELELPRMFEIEVRLRAPLVGGLPDGGLLVPIYPWSGPGGLEFRTHVNLEAALHARLYEAATIVFEGDAVYYALAHVATLKRGG